MTANADSGSVIDAALAQEIEERIEFLNLAYTHFDHDEYMRVILEQRPFRASPNGSLRRTNHG